MCIIKVMYPTHFMLLYCTLSVPYSLYTCPSYSVISITLFHGSSNILHALTSFSRKMCSSDYHTNEVQLHTICVRAAQPYYGLSNLSSSLVRNLLFSKQSFRYQVKQSARRGCLKPGNNTSNQPDVSE